MRLYTIGFTRTTAEHFFERLRAADVRRVIDVRLRTSSQLAGFAKGRDLAYFLQAILEAGYLHEPLLAPTAELLDGYKKQQVSWPEYEERYRRLLDEREVATRLEPARFDEACLLCSEPTAERCHRRLAAEYLSARWPVRSEIVHL